MRMYVPLSDSSFYLIMHWVSLGPKAELCLILLGIYRSLA